MTDIDAFKSDLQDLLERYDVVLSMDIKGDTHGIYSETLNVMSDNVEYPLTEKGEWVLYPQDLDR